MGRPHRLEQISAERGKSSRAFVIELLNEHGSMERVADELGISFRTVYRFCKANNIHRVKQYSVEMEA